MNGRAINLVNEALFDTGTSNIVAPTTADALEVYSNISPNITLIDPAGAFGLPCDEIDRLPAVIDFTLAGKKFTVPSQELNVGPYPNQTGICQTLINSDVNDLSGGIWIIGASLLKYYYTVWDITNASTGVSQLGFASVAHSPPSAC